MPSSTRGSDCISHPCAPHAAARPGPGYAKPCRTPRACAAHGAKARSQGEIAVIGALEIVISLTSLLLIVLILLHRGKGGGLSDMFGGGFTSSFAGSSVVERNLDRFTLITAFIWFASIVGLLLLFKG